MDDIYKNIEEYNSTKKRIVLIVFDDLLSNEKLNPLVTELFIRSRKLNISIVFITQSYFYVPKKILNKFNSLLHYENSKQTRTSTICI